MEQKCDSCSKIMTLLDWVCEYPDGRVHCKDCFSNNANIKANHAKDEVTQQAINEATAEKDAEIADLQAKLGRLQGIIKDCWDFSLGEPPTVRQRNAMYRRIDAEGLLELWETQAE